MKLLPELDSSVVPGWPEPWKIEPALKAGEDPARVIAANGWTVCEEGGVLTASRDPPECLRRIVACVNALEGVPTENLERIAKEPWSWATWRQEVTEWG